MELLLGFILIIISLALLAVIIMAVFFFLDAFLELPYVGAKKDHIKTIMNLSSLKKGETIVDLGSGDGRLLFEVADRGAFAIGYEINPFLIILSKVKRNLKGYDQEVKIINQSFWKADLKVADVIFVYSLKKKMDKFEKFVFGNATKGTRVVANTNPFPNKKPVKTNNRIFLYVI